MFKQAMILCTAVFAVTPVLTGMAQLAIPEEKAYQEVVFPQAQNKSGLLVPSIPSDWEQISLNGVWKLTITGTPEKDFNPPDDAGLKDGYFKKDFNPNFIRSVVPESVLQYLENFANTEEYQQILREIDFVEKYKSQYAGFPYPPTFVTADAVVVQSGHILMIRRRAEPGRGLLALPGGFLDAYGDKSLEDAMLRELREETCLKVPAPVLRGSIVESKVFDAIERSTRGRTITHAFYINLPSGELPRIKAGSDASSAKWIPISKITSSECFEDHYEIINYFTGV
jgi:ADP-ribose pyrophosphatase YjhB (NUDIX family)